MKIRKFLAVPKIALHALDGYFFGGAACWSDRLYFYGALSFGLFAVILCFKVVGLI